MAVVFKATWPSTGDPQGTSVLWRALNWKEFKDFTEKCGHLELTTFSPMSLYMEVYEKVVVAGPHPRAVTAGMATNVALHQLRNNPFSGDIDAVVHKLVEKRNWIKSNYLESCRAVVAATFHIPFETMDTWDADTLFERVVQAEHAVGVQWNPSDPRVAPPAPGAPLTTAQMIEQEKDPKRRSFLKAKERRRIADLEESGQSGQQSTAPQEPRDESFSWRR